MVGVDCDEKLISIVSVCTIILADFMAIPSEGKIDVARRVLYVGGDGQENYTKIQDAVNDATDGDTVIVFSKESSYEENVKILNKSIR